MGLGHIYRSLALAEMLSKVFDCIFLFKEYGLHLPDHVHRVCSDYLLLDKALSVEEEARYIVDNVLTAGDLIVCDGYHFDTEYQAFIRSHGTKLVCIDDIHSCHFVADMLINHAGGITLQDYSVSTHTKCLLGPDYALLRPVFLQAALNSSRQKYKDPWCLLCLGGSDPNNDTVLKLQEMDLLGFSEIHVVVGSGYTYHDILSEFVKRCQTSIVIHQNIEAAEMVALMAKCNYAVTPPSSVSYEYLAVGGNLYLTQIASNQSGMFDFLTKNGFARPYSELKYWQQHVSINPKLIDGKQAKRLLKSFLSLLINYRLATIDDQDLYYQWANDPMTRAQSFATATIDYEAHIGWFKNKLLDNQTYLYIFQLNEDPVGQIRIYVEKSQAIINYSVAPAYRGMGLASILIENISQIIMPLRKLSITQVIGFVKQDNQASRQAFKSNNYTETVASEYPNSYKYTLQIS